MSTPLAAEVALEPEAALKSPWRADLARLGPVRLRADGPAFAAAPVSSDPPPGGLLVTEERAERVRVLLPTAALRVLVWVERADLEKRPVDHVVLLPSAPAPGAPALPGPRRLGKGEVGVELAGGAPVSAFKTIAGAVQVEHEAAGLTLYGWIDPSLLGEVWRSDPLDLARGDLGLTRDTIVFSTPLAGWDGSHQGRGACCDETRIAWAAADAPGLVVRSLGASGAGYTKVDLRTGAARVVGWVPSANVEPAAGVGTLYASVGGFGDGGGGSWLVLAEGATVLDRDVAEAVARASGPATVRLDAAELRDGFALVSVATPWGYLPGRVACGELEVTAPSAYRCAPSR